MKRILRGFALGLSCLFAGVLEGRAATVSVADYGDGTCSLANAQAAYSAASSGDVLLFPAGKCTWSSALTISKPLTIVGAGRGSGGTTLTASGSMPSGFFFITNVTSSAVMRITGFRFAMTGRTTQHAILAQGGVALDALRIDHNRFDYGNAQVQIGGCKGVIDHNDFYNGDKGVSYSAGSAQQADASWVSMAAGTADALFIESNNFIDDENYPSTYNNEKIGTYNGGKLVVRYNQFDFERFPLPVTGVPFMAHGNAAGGAANGYWQAGTGARRGQSVIEFYNNTMRGNRIDFLYISRGSANLVHHNAITNLVANAPRVYFYEEEQYETQWSPKRTAWPAEDQVHNSFIWANTYNGAAYFTEPHHIAIGANSAPYIQLNREVFLHEPRATGGKATFTGMNGASGSFPTDGTVYSTLGTMVFSTQGPNAYYGYVPYTYPHPLTESGDPSPPTPPTNLRVKE